MRARPVSQSGFSPILPDFSTRRNRGDRDGSLDRIEREIDRLTSLVSELLQVTRAENDPQSEFGLVYRARNALTRRLGDERTQVRVRAECVDDGFRVGIEVQQSSTPGDGGREVSEVVKHEEASHVIWFRCEARDSVSCR